MKLKVVLQDGIKDCGICCLLSIIRFYGGEVSKEYLRELTNTSKEGVSLYQLVEGATKLGFSALGMAGDITNIEKSNLPCIAHVILNKNYKHFVVIYEIDKKTNFITIMDPAKGKKIISLAEFKLLSSGNFMFLYPTKKLPLMQKNKFIFQNILSSLSKNKLLLFLFLILTFFYFIFNLLASFHFKFLLDNAINFEVSDNLFLISYLLLIIYLFKELTTIFRNIILNKILTYFDESTTFKTFKQVLLLPYLYYKNRTTGEVISRFRDLITIKTFLANLICFLSTDVISILIFSYFLFKYQNKLALIIILFATFLIFITKINSSKKRKFLHRISKDEDMLNSYLIESISNVDTIKGSHLEKRLIDRFFYKYKNMLDNIYTYYLNFEKLNFIKKLINDFLLVIIYALGSYLVIKGKLTLGEIIIYQSCFTYFNISWKNFIELLENYYDFSIALKRIDDLFVIKQETFTNNFYYLSYDLVGDIIINNLTYKVGSRYLFKNFNFQIKRGEKILITGESGSGKSSLMKILMRYITVPYNVVSIANIDINHYHLENIRNNITYVSNNEYLFTDTIKNNICLYKEISEKDFLNVAAICLLNEIIDKDIAYEKIVEENGFNFSGGERQRIILARSLLRQSNIYIFDEALSQIDIAKEKKILTNMFTYLNDKIVIIISHRFNNKKLFDHTFKLENGALHEK